MSKGYKDEKLKRYSKERSSIEECNICSSKEVYLVSNSIIYGKEYGSGKIHLCLDCWSFVGVHKNSLKPLGILSTDKMRKKKKECHNKFDVVWKSGEVKRKELYSILAERMGIPVKECHFGMFDTDRLDKALRVMADTNWYK